MSLNGLKIVVVDDEEMIRSLIGEILEDEGAEVELFDGGNSAYKFLESNQVNWLISDVNMPDGNGIELIKNMNNLESPTKPHVLLLCGLADEIQNASELGIRKVFKKPDEVEDIIDYIHANSN